MGPQNCHSIDVLRDSMRAWVTARYFLLLNVFHGTREMSHWVKVLCAKLDNLTLSLEAAWLKELTSFHPLTFTRTSIYTTLKRRGRRTFLKLYTEDCIPGQSLKGAWQKTSTLSTLETSWNLPPRHPRMWIYSWEVCHFYLWGKSHSQPVSKLKKISLESAFRYLVVGENISGRCSEQCPCPHSMWSDSGALT